MNDAVGLLGMRLKKPAIKTVDKTKSILKESREQHEYRIQPSCCSELKTVSSLSEGLWRIKFIETAEEKSRFTGYIKYSGRTDK